MDRITFDIFEPDGKKFRLTPNLIFLFFWFVPILLTGLFESFISNISWLSEAFTVYIWIGGIGIICCLAASHFLHEPLKGKITGKIEFGNNFIRVNDDHFDLKNITGLELSLSDYYDRRPQLGGTLNPNLSQGVANQVTFRYKSNQTHVIHFRLMGKHSYLSLSGFINEAVKMGKISAYEAEDLIGKENIVQ